MNLFLHVARNSSVRRRARELVACTGGQEVKVHLLVAKESDRILVVSLWDSLNGGMLARGPAMVRTDAATTDDVAHQRAVEPGGPLVLRGVGSHLIARRP